MVTNALSVRPKVDFSPELVIFLLYHLHCRATFLPFLGCEIITKEIQLAKTKII